MYLCTKFQGAPSKNLNFKMRGWKKKNITSNTINKFMECAGSTQGVRKEQKHPASRTWPSKGALNTETKSF